MYKNNHEYRSKAQFLGKIVLGTTLGAAVLFGGVEALKRYSDRIIAKDEQAYSQAHATAKSKPFTFPDGRYDISKIFTEESCVDYASPEGRALIQRIDEWNPGKTTRPKGQSKDSVPMYKPGEYEWATLCK